MPRRRNERSSSLQTSLILERREARQVLEQRHLDARVRDRSSRTRRPTAPPPTTMMLLGSVRPVVASSLVMMCLPSGSSPGSDLTREPVARITSVRVERPLAVGLAVRVERLDADLLAALSVPRPRMTLDLVLLGQRVEALGQPIDDLPGGAWRDRVVEADVCRP